MNDVFILKVTQGLQNLDGKSSDKTERNTLEIVAFDEFIKIDTEKFKRNQEMTSEFTMIFY